LRKRIPIWIRDIAMPEDGSPITTKQWRKSGADVYLSVIEQRFGGLNITDGACDGQWHEFMACGFIPEKYVTRAMPFDGLIVHEEKPDHDVRSYLDDDYIYDWDVRLWRYDPISKKRKRAADDDGEECAFEKRQRFSVGEIQFEVDVANAFNDMPAQSFCCQKCGHRTTEEDFANKVASMLEHLNIVTVEDDEAS
jgi:hypothetical protein